VVALGICAGAGYMARAVADDPRIRAFAGIAGVYPAAATPDPAVTGRGRAARLRASLWHGALDTVVSPANLTALETMFARLLGASVGATATEAGAVHAVYRDRRGVPMLETWLVTGMGHAWSGGDLRASHTWPPGPTATDRMLDFLLRTDAP